MITFFYPAVGRYNFERFVKTSWGRRLSRIIAESNQRESGQICIPMIWLRLVRPQGDSAPKSQNYPRDNHANQKIRHPGDNYCKKVDVHTSPPSVRICKGLICTCRQYQPMGLGFRLMCTCLDCKYASRPSLPSSRPRPLCL